MVYAYLTYATPSIRDKTGRQKNKSKTPREQVSAVTWEISA